MKISIGADHRGYELKRGLIEQFQHFCHPGPRAGIHPMDAMHYEFLDAGTFSAERTDYPSFARKVCADILAGHAEAGILICGSGVGMSIAANRHKKIYAALCWAPEVAKFAKAHDGANVLVLPADYVSSEVAIKIVTTWLETRFEGGRYERRLCMVDE